MELGKQSTYQSKYNPAKLFGIDRKAKRREIGITGDLPFHGFDVWNHYEVSWLTPKGLPRVALAQIVVPCDSANVIESKSLKLYFNTLNNTSFDDANEVENVTSRDLSICAAAPVSVSLHTLDNPISAMFGLPHGTSIDNQEIPIDHYQVDRQLLRTCDERINETLHSNLLKSNCLVTGQPDWGTVSISYDGHRIDPASLLKYIVSFRNHEEFHEQCVERIFKDIWDQCAPSRLTVGARYTRRGGIDINPIRSSEPIPEILNTRLVRQ
ncbi:NADPH-dependent 7-cyano-7-deazaguanine reductase QueF [Trinickia mobilis]|uniref:NADPH-dependent 7-cyano-7-deazaguanine reductase QueF n=1 Tax=Trinickia mobilis TaxID=2816356 RepID=UPI001A8FB2AA|nr:NADPH-dependent 7-cyano-7-deazaguanine reductase QueF [Trinickia mobilis]